MSSLSGEAVVRINRSRVYRPNGTHRPTEYIYQRLRAVDGLSVGAAKEVVVTNKDGESKLYSEADLRYDLQSGWIVLDSAGEASVDGAAKAAARIGVDDVQIGGHLCELLACLAMRDVPWKEHLRGPDREAIMAAYEKEVSALCGPGCVLRELKSGDAELATARARATQCRFILEFKRTGIWKVRMVVQGFRENKVALDGLGFNYSSNVAGLTAIRNALLSPVPEDNSVAVGSIDIATAFLQSDRFGPEEPTRYLKVRDPVSGSWRYFRQYGPVYGSSSAPKRWENTLHPWLESQGFVQGKNEKCVFYHPMRKVVVITYVDDLLVRGPDRQAKWFMDALCRRFKCKDPQWLAPGTPLDHLGMTVFRDERGVYVSMEGYIESMLKRLGMEGCRLSRGQTPISGPIEDFTPITPDERELFMTACGMIGWLAGTARPDVKYAHSRISQHMATPGRGALRAVLHAVRYCSSTRTACLHQPYGADAEWEFYSDSDHAGNAELQNKRRSQLGYIALRGRCPIAFGSKASSVTFGSQPAADTNPIPVCHPAVSELHADVSSAAAEIYAASVALSEMCYLSYVSDEMGVPIRLPFKLQVDNSTCLAFGQDQIQRSKLRHIDCRQEWVLALRDAKVVQMEWVESESNFADLFTKILEAETFVRLRNQIMAFRSIPSPGGDEGMAEKLSQPDELAAGKSRASNDWPEEAIRNKTDNYDSAPLDVVGKGGGKGAVAP
jgi:hypothetical protein